SPGSAPGRDSAEIQGDQRRPGVGLRRTLFSSMPSHERSAALVEGGEAGAPVPTARILSHHSPITRKTPAGSATIFTSAVPITSTTPLPFALVSRTSTVLTTSNACSVH